MRRADLGVLQSSGKVGFEPMCPAGQDMCLTTRPLIPRCDSNHTLGSMTTISCASHVLSGLDTCASSHAIDSPGMKSAHGHIAPLVRVAGAAGLWDGSDGMYPVRAQSAARPLRRTAHVERLGGPLLGGREHWSWQQRHGEHCKPVSYFIIDRKYKIWSSENSDSGPPSMH